MSRPSVCLATPPSPPPPPTHPPSRITPFPPLQSQDLRQVWAVKGSRSGLVPGGRPRARSRSLGVPGHGGVWRWPSSPPRALGVACAAAGCRALLYPPLCSRWVGHQPSVGKCR